MASSEGRKEIYAEVLAESPDCQKALKHCKRAERFDLNVSADDPGQKNTVKVLRRSGELVGYLEPKVLDKVVPKITEGANVEAFALLVTDGELYNKSRRMRLFRKRPLRCYVKIVA